MTSNSVVDKLLEIWLFLHSSFVLRYEVFKLACFFEGHVVVLYKLKFSTKVAVFFASFQMELKKGE